MGDGICVELKGSKNRPETLDIELAHAKEQHGVY
jgi:hypothetical protein